jgi:hypothetical protein
MFTAAAPNHITTKIEVAALAAELLEPAAILAIPKQIPQSTNPASMNNAVRKPLALAVIRLSSGVKLNPALHMRFQHRQRHCALFQHRVMERPHVELRPQTLLGRRAQFPNP